MSPDESGQLNVEPSVSPTGRRVTLEFTEDAAREQDRLHKVSGLSVSQQIQGGLSLFRQAAQAGLGRGGRLIVVDSGDDETVEQVI